MPPILPEWRSVDQPITRVLQPLITLWILTAIKLKTAILPADNTGWKAADPGLVTGVGCVLVQALCTRQKRDHLTWNDSRLEM